MIRFIHTRRLGGRYCSKSYWINDKMETWIAIQPAGNQYQAWGATVLILHIQGPHWAGGLRPEGSGQCRQGSHCRAWLPGRQAGRLVGRQSDLLHIVSWKETFLAMQPALPPARRICGGEETLEKAHMPILCLLYSSWIMFFFAFEKWSHVALVVFRHTMYGAGEMA